MLNKLMVIGRLGKDVESRFFQDGTACCNFSVACSESWKDKETGEKKEHTEWINVSAVGRLAEICGQYLNKGSLVYCEGKQATRKYQDRDGNDRYVTELKLQNMKMLGSKQDNASSSNKGQGGFPTQGGNQQPVNNQQQAGSPAQGGNQQPAQQRPQHNNDPFGGKADFGDVPVDDDIPF